MKVLKHNSFGIIIISVVVITILTLNLFLDIHPVLDFLKSLEGDKIYWTIPSGILLLYGFWLFDRSMRRKIICERVEIYNATIRTIQHFLNNSSSSMQLLILDMKDEGVNEEIIAKAEKNIEELKKVIETLASIDPESIEFNDLNRKMSIIKMDE